MGHILKYGTHSVKFSPTGALPFHLLERELPSYITNSGYGYVDRLPSAANEWFKNGLYESAVPVLADFSTANKYMDSHWMAAMWLYITTQPVVTVSNAVAPTYILNSYGVQATAGTVVLNTQIGLLPPQLRKNTFCGKDVKITMPFAAAYTETTISITVADIVSATAAWTGNTMNVVLALSGTYAYTDLETVLRAATGTPPAGFDMNQIYVMAWGGGNLTMGLSETMSGTCYCAVRCIIPSGGITLGNFVTVPVGRTGWVDKTLTKVQMDTWHHVVYNYRRDTPTYVQAELYFDGTYVGKAQDPNSTTQNFTKTAFFTLGYSGTVNNLPTFGVDEFVLAPAVAVYAGSVPPFVTTLYGDGLPTKVYRRAGNVVSSPYNYFDFDALVNTDEVYDYIQGTQKFNLVKSSTASMLTY